MIVIPPKIEELLSHDRVLSAAARLSFAEFEPWIEASGTPFFPEYTNHGIQHITDVLATASSLVRDDARAVLTASDAAMLCIAGVLHDSATHLTEDGFLSLITDPSRPRVAKDDILWNELWSDFLSEASRFDGRKLTALFGSDEPIHRPDEKPDKWTRRDRLLMGEFLRRHHARLAHEIAIAGVPGPTNDPLRLKQVPNDLADLAGLIARSHGLPLRECLKRLDPNDPREYKGVHAVFLMALLRIADYLQIQAERAPRQLLQVQGLRSPISAREWQAHEAVVDIRHTHSDPEALFVQAAPQDSKTYLKLKWLLRSIQLELDQCWAVIGEVYGRYEHLSSLGLTIRRIRSNLDDDEQFASTVSYIPCDARFDAAGADLLKLLIHPLYGDKPEIGIRELLQNAVDACLELKDLAEQDLRPSDTDTVDQDADVVITLEEVSANERYLTVSDRGIGMTPAVLIHYFLKAGASFRRSDAWREQHESTSGRSRVLRSGRFGVGALATFLLGDEIEVSTRHARARPEQGIAFKATLDAEQIQLNHYTRAVGTTIKIRIRDNNIWHKLSAPHWRGTEEFKPEDLTLWDWFCLDFPRVKRILKLQGNQTKTLGQRWILPPAGKQLSLPWHRLCVQGYEDVHWTQNRKLPPLVCNGITVEERPPYYERERVISISEGLNLRRPNLSIFDPDGNLPLNLSRTGLSVNALPFKDQLRESLCRDFIAWLLVNAPSEVPKLPQDRIISFQWSYPEMPRPTLAFTNLGSVLVDKWAVAQIPSSRAIFVPAEAKLKISPEKGELLVPLNMKYAGVDIQKAWLRYAVGDFSLRPAFASFDGLQIPGRRTVIATSFYKQIQKPGIIARFLWDRLTEEASNRHWTILASLGCPEGRLDFSELIKYPPSAEIGGVTEFVPSRLFNGHPERVITEPGKPSAIADIWSNLCDQLVIPYDLHERKRQFRKAYVALEPLIAHYEAQKSQQGT